MNTDQPEETTDNPEAEHEEAPAEQVVSGPPADSPFVEELPRMAGPPADEGDETSVSDETEDDGRKGNPEAAKWRVKYRETSARLERLQRAEITRLAAGPGRLIDGEDVFRSGEIADFLTDDGDLDPDKITAVVSELVKAKPHLGRPAFGDGVGVGERNPTEQSSWSGVLRG